MCWTSIRPSRRIFMCGASSPYNSLAGKRTYTVEEIAKILGIGRTAAYSLVHSGVFKAVRIGSSIRVSKVSFDDWLDKQNM